VPWTGASAPIWARMLGTLSPIQDCVTLPSASSWHDISYTVTCLPVGGMPISGPVCVPRVVNRQ
jgi:hypothetical protein